MGGFFPRGILPRRILTRGFRPDTGRFRYLSLSEYVRCRVYGISLVARI